MSIVVLFAFPHISYVGFFLPLQLCFHIKTFYFLLLLRETVLKLVEDRGRQTLRGDIPSEVALIIQLWQPNHRPVRCLCVAVQLTYSQSKWE